MEKLTIIKPLDEVTEEELLRYIGHNFHIICKCNCDIFVGTGKYRNDDFVLLEDSDDKMTNVYGFTCPKCKKKYRIMAKDLRVLHVTNETQY